MLLGSARAPWACSQRAANGLKYSQKKYSLALKTRFGWSGSPTPCTGTRTESLAMTHTCIAEAMLARRGRPRALPTLWQARYAPKALHRRACSPPRQACHSTLAQHALLPRWCRRSSSHAHSRSQAARHRGCRCTKSIKAQDLFCVENLLPKGEGAGGPSAEGAGGFPRVVQHVLGT